MANICVGCGLTTDTDGKLIAEIAPDIACKHNLLSCDADGLRVTNKTYTLRRDFSANTAATNQVTFFGVGRLPSQYGTTVDNGSAAGIWTVNADGTITINCDGIYAITQSTDVNGASGQVIGGRARVAISPANVFVSTEFRDESHSVVLERPNPNPDGPEFMASNTAHLPAGTSLTPISNVYTAAAGPVVQFSGEFTLTYLGAFA